MLISLTRLRLSRRELLRGLALQQAKLRALATENTQLKARNANLQSTLTLIAHCRPLADPEHFIIQMQQAPTGTANGDAAGSEPSIASGGSLAVARPASQADDTVKKSVITPTAIDVRLHFSELVDSELACAAQLRASQLVSNPVTLELLKDSMFASRSIESLCFFLDVQASCVATRSWCSTFVMRRRTKRRVRPPTLQARR